MLNYSLYYTSLPIEWTIWRRPLFCTFYPRSWQQLIEVTSQQSFCSIYRLRSLRSITTFCSNVWKFHMVSPDVQYSGFSHICAIEHNMFVLDWLKSSIVRRACFKRKIVGGQCCCPIDDCGRPKAAWGLGEGGGLGAPSRQGVPGV